MSSDTTIDSANNSGEPPPNNLDVEHVAIIKDSLAETTPPLKLHLSLEARMAQAESSTADGDVRAALLDSWKSFWRIRKMNLKPHSSLLIERGDLVHGIGKYDLGKLGGIFKSGIVSGELDLAGRPALAEDGETFGCADFFVNTVRARSVKEYSQFAWKPSSLSSGIIMKPIEHSFVPSPFGDKKVALVLDSSINELQPLIRQSVTSQTLSTHPILSKLISHFPSTTDRHLAVLGGLPANSINKVIVGNKITDEEVESIYKLASESGLTLNVFKSSGELMPR